MEVGRVVGVYGRNVMRVAVPEEKLYLVARPGTYVKVKSLSGGWLYGLVVGYNLLDELYRRGRIVEELEGYEEFRPARNELLANLVGYAEDGKLQRGVPAMPKPGDKVFLVDEKELSAIMSRGDISIGVLSSARSVEVKLDVSKLCSRHLAILAMTGAGKSNALAVILAEILGKFPYPRILLIDTHSEYVGLAAYEKFNARVYAPSGRLGKLISDQYGIDVLPLEVPIWMLGFEEVAGLLKLDARATKQRMLLREAMRDVRRRRSPGAGVNDPIYYRVEELQSALRRLSGGRGDALLDLQLKVEELGENEELRFITETPRSDELYESLSNLEEPERSFKAYTAVASRFLRPGLNILALGGLSSETQVAVVSTLLRALWRVIMTQRLMGLILPVLIAVEEAHAYAPRDRWLASREILERIAKEGRKFGVALAVVSQRPRELSETLLAQCGNLIALRTVNPEDQRHILRSVEDITQEMIQSLSGLEVGEAIVSGPATPLPAVIKVHEFSSRHGVELGGKDVDWRRAWSEPGEELKVLPAEVVEEAKQSTLFDFV